MFGNTKFVSTLHIREESDLAKTPILGGKMVMADIQQRNWWTIDVSCFYYYIIYQSYDKSDYDNSLSLKYSFRSSWQSITPYFTMLLVLSQSSSTFKSFMNAPLRESIPTSESRYRGKAYATPPFYIYTLLVTIKLLHFFSGFTVSFWMISLFFT